MVLRGKTASKAPPETMVRTVQREKPALHHRRPGKPALHHRRRPTFAHRLALTE
jgi:hypothetical protein